MKGIVFTEFLEMVEDRFSPQVADDILDGADLESDGAYTAVGTYDHSEILTLLSRLGSETDIPTDYLLRTFGGHLFSRFAAGHGGLFSGAETAFDMLNSVEEDYIHVEVLKLPDAELPTFECESPDAATLVMTYRSTRPLASFAEGLISGCINHFGETISLERENLPGLPGTAARFRLVRAA